MFWCYLINVLTHFPGFYWWWQCEDLIKSSVLASCLTSSILMHITERSHGLSGCLKSCECLYLRHQTFVILDRTCAVILCLLTAMHRYPWIHYQYVVVLIIIFIGMLIGKFSKSLIVYMILHNIWHLGVFYMAGRIIVTEELIW